MARGDPDPLRTPDGRYVVVRGRLWRCSDRRHSAEERRRLTEELMYGRAVGRLRERERPRCRSRRGRSRQGGARRTRAGLVEQRGSGLYAAYGAHDTVRGLV